ncbi:hypothetical protein HII36_20835 [Nonomuraea sp. NN258]|uniref:hypothetical protein n=1 Tax=Nonomuraea antri TaxID=2730852 RepID=UPI0015699EBA|nr:hypothetical protein [Nonomuraea antri]NRQ34280.1 hypothetical protein [Nonomuraea antri]
MLVAAAVCPQTPLIVSQLPDLRSACHTAIAALRAARPDTLIVVGPAESTAAYDARAAGTLRPWGLDDTIGEGEPVLPLSLTVGRLLLQGDAPGQAIAHDTPPAGCLALGAELAARGDRVALLVMADGSACLSSRAPGKYDDDAKPVNDLIATAVAEADQAALAGLDPERADRLWVSGRPALQVLAGAAGPAAFTGRLLAQSEPYGVGYFAGIWS